MAPSYSPEDKLHTGLEVEGVVQNNMESLAQWAQINAVIGFVSLALSLLGSILAYNKVSVFDATSGMPMFIVGIVSFALNLIINFSLFNFSRQLKKAISEENQEALDKAGAHLKNYFMLFVIMMIIIIILASAAGSMGGFSGR